MSDDHQFSADKIFGFLFLYTALEVAWGTLFDFPRWAIWGGLLIFAFLKGYLIFTWFMHMKFEGWVVKGLVAPTIPLVAIVLFANMPDTSYNDNMLHNIGDQLDTKTGEVVGLSAGSHAEDEHGTDEEHSDGH